MRIAIIGAGNVGGGLGTAFRVVGHDVVFGVRDPESAKTRAALDVAPGATATSAAEAVRDADVVVFALRWDAAAETIPTLGSLDGRIVVDAMNRFGTPRSTADDLVELLPGAKVAKCFNTIGAENFATARDREQPAAMFVAGDDAQAKQTALDLATEIGFDAVDAGALANARALEDLVKVWLSLSQTYGRTIGFALSRG